MKDGIKLFEKLDEQSEEALKKVHYSKLVSALDGCSDHKALWHAIRVHFGVEIDQLIADKICEENLMDEGQAVEWVASNLSPLEVFGEPERY